MGSFWDGTLATLIDFSALHKALRLNRSALSVAGGLVVLSTERPPDRTSLLPQQFQLLHLMSALASQWDGADALTWSLEALSATAMVPRMLQDMQASIRFTGSVSISVSFWRILSPPFELLNALMHSPRSLRLLLAEHDAASLRFCAAALRDRRTFVPLAASFSTGPTSSLSTYIDTLATALAPAAAQHDAMAVGDTAVSLLSWVSLLLALTAESADRGDVLDDAPISAATVAKALWVDTEVVTAEAQLTSPRVAALFVLARAESHTLPLLIRVARAAAAAIGAFDAMMEAPLRSLLARLLTRALSLIDRLTVEWYGDAEFSLPAGEELSATLVETMDVIIDAQSNTPEVAALRRALYALLRSLTADRADEYGPVCRVNVTPPRPLLSLLLARCKFSAVGAEEGLRLLHAVLPPLADKAKGPKPRRRALLVHLGRSLDVEFIVAAMTNTREVPLLALLLHVTAKAGGLFAIAIDDAAAALAVAFARAAMTALTYANEPLAARAGAKPRGFDVRAGLNAMLTLLAMTATRGGVAALCGIAQMLVPFLEVTLLNMRKRIAGVNEMLSPVLRAMRANSQSPPGTDEARACWAFERLEHSYVGSLVLGAASKSQAWKIILTAPMNRAGGDGTQTNLAEFVEGLEASANVAESAAHATAPTANAAAATSNAAAAAADVRSPPKTHKSASDVRERRASFESRNRHGSSPDRHRRRESPPRRRESPRRRDDRRRSVSPDSRGRRASPDGRGRRRSPEPYRRDRSRSREYDARGGRDGRRPGRY